MIYYPSGNNYGLISFSNIGDYCRLLIANGGAKAHAIEFAQYSGAYNDAENKETINSVTLLSEEGNTSFPHDVDIGGNVKIMNKLLIDSSTSKINAELLPSSSFEGYTIVDE